MEYKGCNAEPTFIPSSKMLCELAIYLEGLKKGQGNLLPLGSLHLENLWEAVKHFQRLESMDKK